MPAKRIVMRKIREVLRLRLEAGLSFRQISASTKVSIGAAQKLVSQAATLGLTWPLSPALDDSQLAGCFIPMPTPIYQLGGMTWVKELGSYGNLTIELALTATFSERVKDWTTNTQRFQILRIDVCGQKKSDFNLRCDEGVLKCQSNYTSHGLRQFM